MCLLSSNLTSSRFREPWLLLFCTTLMLVSTSHSECDVFRRREKQHNALRKTFINANKSDLKRASMCKNIIYNLKKEIRNSFVCKFNEI